MSEMTQEEVAERIEHRDALLNIRAILKTAAGREFLKYLLRHYDPIFLPEMGLEGPLLYEQLGHRRTCIEIYNLIAEADPTAAAEIIALNTKDRNEKRIREDVEARQENRQPTPGRD